MKFKMKKLAPLTFVLVMLTLIASVYTTGQQIDRAFWRDVSEAAIVDKSDRLIVPEKYRTLALDLADLRSYLDQAPREIEIGAKYSSFIVNLPLPDGSFGRFSAVESPIMAPELGAKFPEIRTYLGQGIDEPTASARFDITPAGFHAIIFSSAGTIYIDPYQQDRADYYISYFKRDLLPDPSRTFIEEAPLDTDSEIAREIAHYVAQGLAVSSGTELRSYRLAVAATGEYTQFHGGTVQAGMAAVVTAMNRVNGIYEREVAVRMVLVSNNDLLIYTNASTDPYTNNNGSTMLGQNQTTLDNVIGDANYDIGHVFSTGGGGIARLGVPCRSGLKAGGVTGLPSPIGDPFYVDYVAHEMGHQYGANHTFNGNAGSCAGGNRNASTAYEPGSGTTIMAYAGICSPQNIQNLSDDYFHGASIDEIVAYTTLSSGNSCPVRTLTGNRPAVVNAGISGITIPIRTPFIMTGSASDPDLDTLTYCWEEFDLGAAGHPNTPSGNAPIFRSFRPANTPSRVFPRMSDVIGNVQTMGELLPTYARTLSFRLTARDNRAGGGGVGKASTSINVTANAGPFIVTAPNTDLTWVANNTHPVRWDVASTNLSPVNCTVVNILLSTDGGTSFPITLAANTPNDGSEDVVAPNNLSSSARVKVEAANNIFFDISNVNFTLASLASPRLLFPADSTLGQPTAIAFRWNSVSSATAYRLQVATNPLFILGLVVNDSSLTDTTFLASGLNASTQYYWRLRAKNNSGWSGWSPVFTFRTTLPVPAAPVLVSPANNSTSQPTTLSLSWSGSTGAISYRLLLSTDSTFAAAFIDDSTITGTSRTVGSLANNVRYFWKVNAKNAAGTSLFSTVWNFVTVLQTPSQVQLLIPVDSSNVGSDSVRFVWSMSQPAVSRYWFEIDTRPTFSTSTIDSTIVDTSKTVYQLVPNSTYWWRVRANNTEGWGPFGPAYRFQTMLTSVKAVEELPTISGLEQNYPNPFNPTTTISFILPEDAIVTLKIYNTIGQEVATLANKELYTEGMNELEFDASRLSSGIYFYQMIANGVGENAGKFSTVKKMVLMK